MVQKIKKIVAGFAFYLSLCGLFGFSLFIFEEAIQTTMFSTWQSADCQDWATVYESTKIMEGFCGTMRVINYIGGWINPLCYLSYGAYATATDQYIKASRAKILAHAPYLFISTTITITLQPPAPRASAVWTIREDGAWVTTVGSITIISPTQIKPNTQITGLLSNDLAIDLR